jgi:shikimate 5-dehydrogenase
VVEFVPADRTTPLIEEARARGLFTVDGWQVMAVEGDLHFRLMTGVAMPPGAVRDLSAPLRGDDPPLTEES